MTLKRYFMTILMFYIVVVVLAVVNGCMTLDKANGILEERNVALLSIEVLEQEAVGYLAELDKLIAEGAPGSAKAANLIRTAMLENTEEAVKWKTFVVDLNTQISDAEDGFDVATAILSGIAGFFPPALAVVPLISRGKRVLAAAKQDADRLFNGVVDAMAAGGGPTNKAEARAAILTVSGLKDKITDRRVFTGDKVLMETEVVAVPPSAAVSGKVVSAKPGGQV